MNRLFSGVASNGSSFGFSGGLSAFGTATQPEIELQESGDEYRVIISIAKDSQVELVTELEDNTLSISAQVRSEVRNSASGVQSSSTSISQFARSIPLEEPVNATGLQTEKSPEEIVITIPKIG
ncbi:MAG: Hsp20/alpha crystallin family protein [Gammaproteobacteria bacterium]|nr:Hsp20/alpha crystallin family protein [Gammaproteobacteria bacterium]